MGLETSNLANGAVGLAGMVAEAWTVRTWSYEDCRQSIFRYVGFAPRQTPLRLQCEVQFRRALPSCGRTASCLLRVPRSWGIQTVCDDPKQNKFSQLTWDLPCLSVKFCSNIPFCCTEGVVFPDKNVYFRFQQSRTRDKCLNTKVQLTCPFTESTLARMYFLTAAIRVARLCPVARTVAIWNFTTSPCCRKSCLSAKLVMP